MTGYIVVYKAEGDVRWSVNRPLSVVDKPIAEAAVAVLQYEHPTWAVKVAEVTVSE